MPEINSILSRTSIFDSTVASNGIHKEAHKVKIVQNSSKLTDSGIENNVVIEGYLKEPLNFDLNAQWEKKDSFVSSLLSSDIANTVLGFTEKVGLGASHAGYVTRKYYTGGTDIQFNLNMRITDVNGKGEVINAVGKLAGLMLPSQLVDARISEMFPTQTQQLVQAGEELEGKLATGTGIGSAIGQTGVISTAIDEATSAGITATQSPTPVAVYIGEYILHTDMVITGCNVTFSKDLVEIRKVTDETETDGPGTNPEYYSAPLYVDINLQVQSRENLYLKKDENEAKGTRINSMYWGQDARNSLTETVDAQTDAVGNQFEGESL
jgi:hypothetical protein